MQALTKAFTLCTVALGALTLTACTTGSNYGDQQRSTEGPGNKAAWYQYNDEGQIIGEYFVDSNRSPAITAVNSDGTIDRVADQPSTSFSVFIAPEGSTRFVFDDQAERAAESIKIYGPTGTILADITGLRGEFNTAEYNEQVIQALLTSESFSDNNAALAREALQAGATIGEAITRALTPLP